MPVTDPVPFVPGTTPGQAPSESDPPEHLDMASLLSVRSADAFRGSPNEALLLAFLAESMQITETVHQQVRQLCWVRSAEGAQLDKALDDIGGLRDGRTDAQMRRLIPARWSALFRERSLKLLHDVLTLLCTDDGVTFDYQNTGTASFQITLFDVPSVEFGDETHQLVLLSKPEGVGMRTLVVLDSEEAFRFDVGPGLDEGVVAHYAV